MQVRDGSDFVKVLMETIARNNRTAVVVRIDEYNASESSANATPLVQEERVIDREVLFVPSSSIPGCPVLWFGGGGRAFNMGLKQGDYAIGLYRHRSHDEIDNGDIGPLIPASNRRSDNADLVILGGFIPPSIGLDADAYREDGQVVLSMPSDEFFHVGASTATFLLVRKDHLENHLSDIRNWAFSHKHIYADGITEGVDPLDIATYPPTPDMSSQRIKVDK